MRLVLFILATLFITTLIVLAALENPGYVLIARAPHSIEMSLTVFVLLLAVGFVVTYGVGYGLFRLMRIPRDVMRWRLRRQVRRARVTLANGLTKLSEGDFAAAETELLAGLRHGDSPLLNYLACAYCAQEQGTIEKRDEYLANAQRSAPQHALAVGMMQARLQQLAHQHEQALATLAGLKQAHPRHRQLLKLLAEVCQELRDWTGLAELVPSLRNHAALKPAEIDALELRAHKELLALTLPSGARDVLARAWGAVPKTLKRNPTLLAIYARQLLAQTEMQEAESILRAALDAEWDSELAALYGHVHGEQPAEQLAHAEAWLAGHPDDAALSVSCGRLALRANDMTKARGYFEKAVALDAAPDAYRELGQLLERLGEKDKALSAYRRGLDAVTAERPGARRNNSAPPRYRLVR